VRLKLFDKLRRKAQWNVYNMFDLYEFAECSNCGAEVEPDFSLFPEIIYPERCPDCGAKMVDTVAVY